MIYAFGFLLFIAGAFIATQNTASRVSVPLMVIGIVLVVSHAMAADNNPFSGASGIRVTMVREKVKTVGASTRHHRRPAIAPSPRVATHPSPE